MSGKTALKTYGKRLQKTNQCSGPETDATGGNPGHISTLPSVNIPPQSERRVVQYCKETIPKKKKKNLHPFKALKIR